VGGLIGENFDDVTESYATGNVMSTPPETWAASSGRTKAMSPSRMRPAMSKATKTMGAASPG